MEAMTPMGRLGAVEDIAAAALYLASPAASWVTGKVFEVDGGTEASNRPIKIPAY
jgi:7-alpha-hydroxysteroid dehydrogenase